VGNGVLQCGHDLSRAERIQRGIRGLQSGPHRVAPPGSADQRVDFAFETTLAGGTLAPFLRKLVETGYEAHLVFFWVPAPEPNIICVADRGIESALIARGFSTEAREIAWKDGKTFWLQPEDA
jgi:hypothetical protein